MQLRGWVYAWLLTTAAVYAGVWFGRVVHEWRAVRSIQRSLAHQAQRQTQLLPARSVERELACRAWSRQ